MGLRPRAAAVPAVRYGNRGTETGTRCEVDLLVSELSDIVMWLALAGGTAAAAAALYGHYHVLPAWLTGPEICRLEDGGCARALPQPAVGAARRAERVARARALRAARGRPRRCSAPAWLLLTMTIPGGRDERIPRPQPDRQRPPVPDLLDRPLLERRPVFVLLAAEIARALTGRPPTAPRREIAVLPSLRRRVQRRSGLCPYERG